VNPRRRHVPLGPERQRDVRCDLSRQAHAVSRWKLVSLRRAVDEQQRASRMFVDGGIGPERDATVTIRAKRFERRAVCLSHRRRRIGAAVDDEDGQNFAEHTRRNRSQRLQQFAPFAVGGNRQHVTELAPEWAECARFGFRVAIEVLVLGARHSQPRCQCRAALIGSSDTICASSSSHSDSRLLTALLSKYSSARSTKSSRCRPSDSVKFA